MPAQVDDTNYDIWLEHTSAKVPYRLARDEDGNVMLSTGSAPTTAQQIYTGGLSLESINANVTIPISYEDWSGGAGFFDADVSDPVGAKVYYTSGDMDTSWPNKLYIGPEAGSTVTTVEAPLKFVNSVYGLFAMTARYVREWTGAAWTERLDTGGTNTNTDLIEFSNLTGTYLVLGVSGGNYYVSTDGTSWIAVGSSPTAGPAFRAVQAASGTGTSATVTKPTGTVDNDIMIATVGIRTPGSIWSVSAPAGWTALASSLAIQNNIHAAAIYWKRASSEGADYTFTWTTSSLYRVSIVSYSGCITTGSPFDDNSVTSNATDSVTHTIPALTSSGSNRLAVATFSAFDDADSSISFTAPSGYTERYDAAGVVGMEIVELAVASAGAVASTTATATVSSFGLGWHGLLIPSISGTGTATVLDISRFAIRGQSNGNPLLWAITSTGDIRNTEDPTDGSAWSAADSIRMGVGSTIVGLEVVDNVFYLFHSKGITSYDGTAVSTVWRNDTITLESDAARPYTWVDKAVYFTFGGTLLRYTADSNVIEKMWPKSRQGGATSANGVITSITGDAANLWFCLKAANGAYYLTKCDPYRSLTYLDEPFMPIHTIKEMAACKAIIIAPASSNTFSTTNPHVVAGSTTNARHYILPRYGLEPKDDSNYLFSTSDANLVGSWTGGAARTFNKFINSVTSIGENQSATLLSKIYFQIDNGSSTLAHNLSANAVATVGLSTDYEFSKIRPYIELETTVNTSSPRLLGTVFNTSLNPSRYRQWEMYIEIANDTEMLGGGESRHGARYLDNHLFTGLTERVTFYDRLGNSFITKIVEVTSQVRGEDVDVYKVTLVQLV